MGYQERSFVSSKGCFYKDTWELVIERLPIPDKLGMGGLSF